MGQGRDGTGTSVGDGRLGILRGPTSSVVWDSPTTPEAGKASSSSSFHGALSTGWCWERLGQSSAPHLCSEAAAPVTGLS